MKKAYLGLILVCLLLGGIMTWFLCDRIDAYRQTEAGLQTLRQVRDQLQVELVDEEKTVFVHDEAIEGFAEAAKPKINEDVAQYISPEGIRFRSLSTSWSSRELEELYEELLRNKHGEEIYTLAEVVVYPQPDDYAAASHGSDGHNYRLSLCFPSLPQKTTFSFYRQGGRISLYDGNEKGDVASMAGSLSHEYGHHYTFYYMLKDAEGIRAYEGTEYERLRQIDPERLKLVRLSTQDYMENHHWFYFEIAAEDYVVLMGSPNARSVVDYYDVREAMDGREDQSAYGKNMDVQENLMIPMATQVEGLAEYFYSFIDEPTPEYAPKEIQIEMEQDSVSYNLTTGYRTFRSYNFTWNKAYGEDAVYTLVCFDPENYLESRHPVRTVTAGEEARAVVGQVTRDEGSRIYFYDDGLAEGTRYFVVTVILPDGTMYCSEPFIHTF